MLNEQDMQWVHETVEKIIKKMDWVSDKSKNKIPSTTVNGEHDDRGSFPKNFMISASSPVEGERNSVTIETNATMDMK